MNKIKLIRIISIFFLIFGVIIVLITNFKDSYANENNIYTREELQEFVVSTALSFYYNQEYSNYEQYAMDDKEYNPIYYNNETKKNAKYESGTFYFRTFNQTPESTSRANYYNIDCDSFTSIVFINSLGYDFSEYYYLSDRKYFDSSEIGYYNTNESVENFKNGYKNYGLGSITPYTKISNEQIPEEDGLLIYNYNFLHNETEETKEMLKQEIKNILQPGDQLLWTYQNIETGMKNGHTGIYIGDKFEDAGGVIDASGVDYNFDNNPNASGEGIGSDYFAVRYNSYSTIEQNIFESSINHVLSVRIFRPINEFCEKDTCKLHIDENATQRPNFSNLKVEQYASKDNKSLSLYNSVNSQDIITYNLNITNKSDFEFCSNGRYATYQDAKDYCEKITLNGKY